MPSFQLGISKVDEWHQGFSDNSFSMTDAKCSDQPLRGKAAHVVSISRGWIKFERLEKTDGEEHFVTFENPLTSRHYLRREIRRSEKKSKFDIKVHTQDSRQLKNLTNHGNVAPLAKG